MAEQQHPRERAKHGEQHDGSNSQTVPTKMIGLWERKYIRFLKDNDDEDQHGDGTDTYGDRQTAERVLWLQTASGFGDMRIPKSRFSSGGNSNNKRHECTASSLAELSVGKLLQLAEADCFCGICILEENTLSREGRPKSNWIAGDTGFSQQVVSNWPEDGWLEWPETDLDSTPTKGTCMMEYAPEGQYIEDWRLQPGSSGLCCHLTTKTAYASDDIDGERITRNIYMAGVHLMLAIDRRRGEQEEENRPLVAIVKDRHMKNRALVESYLSQEFSYAKKTDSKATDFGVELSTLPWRQGGTISMDWLHDVVLGSKHDSTVTPQRLPTLPQKEGTLVTDNQGVEWKIVSIGYREN